MKTLVEVRSGVTLAVEDGGHGPPVVLLHGLAGFKEIWADFLPLLRDSGYRAIAYDHRGHGESGDVTPPWTIRDLSEDLASLLDRLSVAQACLIGHSMGGRTLFQFVLDRPERTWAVVSVAAHSEAPRSPYREALLRVRDMTLRGGVPGFRTAFGAAGEIPERVFSDPIFAEKFEALFARNRAETLVAALDAILTMPLLTPRLAEITVPALSVVGERDTPFHDLAVWYERTLPSCRNVVISDCHHYPMIDQPVAFAEAVVEFLKGVRTNTRR